MCPLNLLTINTWKNEGNYRQRLALLTEQLAQLRPDIIACQEVFRSDTADTGRELAHALGMYYTLAPARHKRRLFEGKLTDSISGLAILSRFPIQRTEVLPLPTHLEDGDRLAQFVWFSVNARPVLVINTHLTHLRGQSELRKQQLDALLAHPALTEPGVAVFLCGDFNADLQSDEIQFMLAHPTVLVQNTYQLGNGLLPGYTMPDRTRARPGRCIDFIFSLKTVDHLPITITNAQIVLDKPDDAGNYPSDHCGVLVRTELLPS